MRGRIDRLLNMLTYSKYNYITRLPEGGMALYNFRTGNCVRLNFLTKDLFDRALQMDPSNAEIQKLKKLGFLVDFDERKHMEILAHLSSGRTDQIGLCICPTFDCNFDCPYCFEDHRKGVMSAGTQDNLIRFTERLTKEAHPRLLSVTWFGGEPLMACEVIKSLSERMIRLCEENRMEYTASIVTNGWFLTQETADMLQACRICNIQITLDGPTAEIHDKTRHLRGGQGTFERIMQNLSQIKTDIPLEIRCNIQKENADCIPQMKEKLHRMEETTGNQIAHHFGFVDGEISTHDRAFSHEAAFDEEGFARLFPQQKKPPRLRFRGSTCIAQHMTGFGVDELGNIYKCWETLGIEQAALGNVADYSVTGEPDYRIEHLHEFLDTIWPSEDEECMNCILLPYCLGGCPAKRVRGLKRRCSPYRYKLDAYVIDRCRYVYQKAVSHQEGRDAE